MMHSNVAQLLSETFLKMILTHQRNIEILKTYKMATKGKHDEKHILQYVPQQDVNATAMKTTDMLLFVNTTKASVQNSFGRTFSPLRD